MPQPLGDVRRTAPLFLPGKSSTPCRVAEPRACSSGIAPSQPGRTPWGGGEFEGLSFSALDFPAGQCKNRFLGCLVTNVHLLHANRMQVARAGSSGALQALRAAFYPRHRAVVRGDAPRDRAGSRAARAPSGDHPLHCRAGGIAAGARAATSGMALTDEMKARILNTFLTLMNLRENLDRAALRQPIGRSGGR